MAFSVFAKLCVHSLYLVPEYFHRSRKEPHTVPSWLSPPRRPRSLAPTHLFLSVDSPPLDMSRKWTPTLDTCDFFPKVPLKHFNVCVLPPAPSSTGTVLSVKGADTYGSRGLAQGLTHTICLAEICEANPPHKQGTGSAGGGHVASRPLLPLEPEFLGAGS